MEKTLKLGFTGTQKGMQPRQQALLLKHLARWATLYEHLEIHHGDCIGADEKFHELCILHWPHKLTVVVHPPSNEAKRAFCTYAQQVELPKKPYLDRNKDIVNASNGMLACPKSRDEELRSGTWSTVRFARRTETPIIMLFP